MHRNPEQIYKTYRNNIYGIGFNYFRNENDANDIVQETFYKFIKCKKEFESEEHIRNWLIRVAINECKKVSLSPWRKKRCNLEDYADQLNFETTEQSELFEVVMKLKTKYRQVIHLFYYEDYTTKEIAEILGISQSAVTTRLERGRSQLKKNLEEVWQNE